MNFNKWKESSVFTKIGTVGVLLSALFGFILGFVCIESMSDAFDLLPFDMEGFLVIWLILYYSIDLVVCLGLLFVKKWARSLAIWWGILSVLSFASQISCPSAIFVAYILSIIAAISLFLAKQDFNK